MRLKTETVAVAFDASTWILHEHGSATRIHSWATTARRRRRLPGNRHWPSSLIVWRQIFQGIASAAQAVVCANLAQVAQFTNQLVNLQLLAHDDKVELIQQVFREAGLDFKLVEAVVDGVGGSVMCHPPI